MTQIPPFIASGSFEFPTTGTGGSLSRPFGEKTRMASSSVFGQIQNIKVKILNHLFILYRQLWQFFGDFNENIFGEIFKKKKFVTEYYLIFKNSQNAKICHQKNYWVRVYFNIPYI